jgi:hypothetical protein
MPRSESRYPMRTGALACTVRITTPSRSSARRFLVNIFWEMHGHADHIAPGIAENADLQILAPRMRARRPEPYS